MAHHHELAREVCQYLADYRPDGERCKGIGFRLAHASGDGRGIWISTQDRLKYEVSCDWPKYGTSFYAPDNRPSIGVTKTRGAQVLAREISRRLLPEYHEEYPRRLVEKQSWIDHENGERAVRAEMLEAIDPGRPLPPHQEESMQLTVYACGLTKLKISGNTVALETCYLPRAVALEVVALLKKSGVEH